MYYYMSNDGSGLIIKRTELVKFGDVDFDGIIVRISDEDSKELAYEVGDYSEEWNKVHFHLMTDEELKNEGITREYLYQELENGGYIIVREMNYYKDGKRFDGILDYFSTDENEDMYIGNLISGNTSDYKKIDGMERDSMILLERENLEEFDNWLTPSKPATQKDFTNGWNTETFDTIRKLSERNTEGNENFTVVYNRIEGSYPSINYDTKFIHMVCKESQIKDELEKIVNKDNRVVININFVFNGHILPINS